MNSTFTITFGQPENHFWEEFAVLWANSPGRSPFKSPSLLQYFAHKAGDHLAVFQYREDGELRGAILLKENKGVYTFLSDLKTDVNFFLIDRRCAPEEIKAFFGHLLDTVKTRKWSLILNNQPSWAHYMPVFEAAGQASGLFWLNFNYSVCPVATEESPQALFRRINGSRELRYRVNKLKNQVHAEFEVLTDGTDLERWAEEFCEAHILRWADTPTPSHFRDPERREFLRDCLQAWDRDGLLVRFAVKTEQRRVGFVIGLREADSLIHHSTTFHPDFWKYSPGKALIHFMAQWMQENNLRTLDFGDGNEAYKYEVANEEHILNRIFICGKQEYGFIAKARFIKMVKEHPRMYHFYQHRLKPIAAQIVGLSHVFDWIWTGF